MHFTIAECLSLDMEVQGVKQQVQELQSALKSTDNRLTSVLQMQHKILQKLEAIEKAVTHIDNIATPIRDHNTHSHLPYPAEASTFMPGSSPLSRMTFPPPPVLTDHSLPQRECNTSPQQDLLHEPSPIIFTGTALSSTAIRKESLCDANSVMAEHQHLAKEPTVTKLALKLAHKAYFGDDILARCTVMGEQHRPGLPQKELYAMKTLIFQQFPQFWNDRTKFDPIWNSCVDALNGACRRERSKRRKKASGQ